MRLRLFLEPAEYSNQTFATDPDGPVDVTQGYSMPIEIYHRRLAFDNGY